MTRWEYRRLASMDKGKEIMLILDDGRQWDYSKIIEVMNELGQEGWELVSAYYAPRPVAAPDHPSPAGIDQEFWFFKRPSEAHRPDPSGELRASRTK